MGAKIVFLFIFRLLILLLSLATLACHVAQLILLGQVENTGQWWPKYIPYILYYVGPIVSALSATMALLFACFAQKSLWSDRILCVINLLLSIAIIVYNSLQSGTIPWTGSVAKPFKSNMKGFVTYCPNYHDSLSSIRCWLTNGTWLGMVVVGFVWFVFLLYTMILRNSSVYDEDYDDYDFKKDVPMVISQTPVTPQQPAPPKAESMSHYSYHNEPSYLNQKQEINYYSNQKQESDYYMTQPLQQQQQEAKYYTTQPLQQQQQTYDYTAHEYYYNPLQEEQMNHSHPSSGSQDGAPPAIHGAAPTYDEFGRSRNVSKTYTTGHDGQEYPVLTQTPNEH